jgi:hypothetical protein
LWIVPPTTYVRHWFHFVCYHYSNKTRDNVILLYCVDNVRVDVCFLGSYIFITPVQSTYCFQISKHISWSRDWLTSKLLGRCRITSSKYRTDWDWIICLGARVWRGCLVELVRSENLQNSQYHWGYFLFRTWKHWADISFIYCGKSGRMA